jgi:hypothetical protein
MQWLVVEPARQDEAKAERAAQCFIGLEPKTFSFLRFLV